MRPNKAGKQILDYLNTNFKKDILIKLTKEKDEYILMVIDLLQILWGKPESEEKIMEKIVSENYLEIEKKEQGFKMTETEKTKELREKIKKEKELVESKLN